MVPLHHRTKLTESGETSPPVPPPPPQRGKGEDAPSENCAKKRRVGKNYVHHFTPYCMEVTSLCVPLEIGGHTDGDGENLPAPVVMKLEGAERGKSGGTAPAVNTPAPDNPTGLAGDACCECGHTSSCKTARCNN